MLVNKIINPGKIANGGNRKYPVYCTIVVTDDGCLSIAGVVGPKKGGHAAGPVGQIADVLESMELQPGWTEEMVKELEAIWKEWHLIDLHGGTPRLESIIKEWSKNFDEGHYTFEGACEALKEAGLYEDKEFIHNGKPYKYGSAWLKRDLPAEVVGFLRGLPVAVKMPVWA